MFNDGDVHASFPYDIAELSANYFQTVYRSDSTK